MTSISILEFLRTGNFGPVKIGMSRDDIIANLGLPDWHEPKDENYMSASLWSFGGVELSFYDSLHQVHFKPHYLYDPDTTNIMVNPWIFEGGYEPTKQELTVALHKEGIEFKDTGVLLSVRNKDKRKPNPRFIHKESQMQPGDEVGEEVGFLSLRSGIEVIYTGNKVNPVYGTDGTNKVILLGIALNGYFTRFNQPLENLRNSW